MSPRDHLTLVMDPRDTCGDEQAATPDATGDDTLGLAMRFSIRCGTIEKRLSRLEQLDLIVAALARQGNQRAYP